MEAANSAAVAWLRPRLEELGLNADYWKKIRWADFIKDSGAGTPLTDRTLFESACSELLGSKPAGDLTVFLKHQEHLTLGNQDFFRILDPNNMPTLNFVSADVISGKYSVNITTTAISYTDPGPRPRPVTYYPDSGTPIKFSEPFCRLLGFPGISLEATINAADNNCNVVVKETIKAGPFINTVIKHGEFKDPFIGNNEIHQELNRLAAPKIKSESLQTAKRLLLGKGGPTGDSGFAMAALIHSFATGTNLSTSAVCTSDLVLAMVCVHVGVGVLLRQRKTVYNFLKNAPAVFTETYTNVSFKDFSENAGLFSDIIDAAGTFAGKTKKNALKKASTKWVNNTAYKAAMNIMERVLYYPGATSTPETPEKLQERKATALDNITAKLQKAKDDLNRYNEGVSTEMTAFLTKGGVEYLIQGEPVGNIFNFSEIYTKQKDLADSRIRIILDSFTLDEEIAAIRVAADGDALTAANKSAEEAIGSILKVFEKMKYDRLIAKYKVLVSFTGLFKTTPLDEYLAGFQTAFKTALENKSFVTWRKMQETHVIKNYTRSPHRPGTFTGGSRKDRKQRNQRKQTKQSGGAYNLVLIAFIQAINFLELPLTNDFCIEAFNSIEPYLSYLNIDLSEINTEDDIDGNLLAAIVLFLPYMYVTYSTRGAVGLPTTDFFVTQYNLIDKWVPPGLETESYITAKDSDVFGTVHNEPGEDMSAYGVGREGLAALAGDAAAAGGFGGPESSSSGSAGGPNSAAKAKTGGAGGAAVKEFSVLEMWEEMERKPATGPGVGVPRIIGTGPKIGRGFDGGYRRSLRRLGRRKGTRKRSGASHQKRRTRRRK